MSLAVSRKTKSVLLSVHRGSSDEQSGCGRIYVLVDDRLVSGEPSNRHLSMSFAITTISKPILAESRRRFRLSIIEVTTYLACGQSRWTAFGVAHIIMLRSLNYSRYFFLCNACETPLTVGPVHSVSGDRTAEVIKSYSSVCDLLPDE